MIYLKKDGTIKKHYLEACKCILDGKITEHEITEYKDKVTDFYICYSINRPYEYNCKKAYKRKSLLNHIVNIVKEYNLDPHIWYGLDWESIDFKNQDEQFILMQEDIMKYMQ